MARSQSADLFWDALRHSKKLDRCQVSHPATLVLLLPSDAIVIRSFQGVKNQKMFTLSGNVSITSLGAVSRGSSVKGIGRR